MTCAVTFSIVEYDAPPTVEHAALVTTTTAPGAVGTQPVTTITESGTVVTQPVDHSNDYLSDNNAYNVWYVRGNVRLHLQSRSACIARMRPSITISGWVSGQNREGSVNGACCTTCEEWVDPLHRFSSFVARCVQFRSILECTLLLAFAVQCVTSLTPHDLQSQILFSVSHVRAYTCTTTIHTNVYIRRFFYDSF